MIVALPEVIQAARLRLVKDRPYLAAAAWSLVPVERAGLGTVAVDQYWRLYFDPAAVETWPVEELAGTIYHEITHLLWDHHGRGRDLGNPAAWNIAADAEVNDNLLAEGVRLPGRPITPAMLGQPEGRLAEEYYEALQVQKPAPGQGGPAQPQGGGEPGAGGTRQGDGSGAGAGAKHPEPDADGSSAQDTASASAPGSGAENGSSPSPTAEGGGQAGAARPGDRGDTPGSKPGGTAGSEQGDGDGSTSSPSSGKPAAPSGRPGVSSQPPAASVGDGSGGGADGRELGEARAQTPAPGAGRCGSCATGVREWWEDGPPGEGTPPGLTPGEAELVRREVARQVEAARSRGDIPGHWRRWAEEKLRPRVDWRRELAAAVRHALADAAGASDYTYRRPSRRQGQVGNGKVIFPALRQPIPRVAVVVDTSGSVSDQMLARALAEVAGVLKASGQREGVHVLAVDATVQACRRVFRPEQVELAGGGGTDMGEGLAAAEKLRPRPQVAVVITDGYTPWPAEPPWGIRTVVVLVGGGTAPGWAKTIRIDERG